MRKKSKETDSVPAHLDQAGATFFATMREGYGIEDGAGIALLTRAAECVDRIKQAQQAIRKHGAVMSINGRLVSNPGCKLEKEARDGFLASMRLLNVDDAPKAIGRPPRPVGVSYENLARIGSGGRGWPRDV